MPNAALSTPPGGAVQKRVYRNILEAVGNTPLVQLNRISRGLACKLYAKVEFFNPGGSVKDRIGLAMIEEAERAGRLKPGGTVVEATSGNTGVGLAIACAIKGYKSVFVMPDKMSQEKIQFLRAFGSRVVITPTAVAPEDPRSYYSVSRDIVAKTPNCILANQYHNPENPHSHYMATGPEIWDQTEWKVTDVVIGMGTGGTITGVGRYLKEQNPHVCIVGVDPVGSLLYDTHRLGKLPEEPHPKTYKIEGIGEDFLPSALDLSVVDKVVQAGDRESFLMTRRLVKEEGIFCGGSSGSAVVGALRHARGLGPERLVVVILPDSGSRYLSKVFDDKWMRENGFLETAWAEATAAEVLGERGLRPVITSRITDTMSEVINLLKEHDISQIPVLDSDGRLAGLASEVNLLSHMLLPGHEHTPGETLENLDLSGPIVVSPEAPLDEFLPEMLKGQVAVVMEGQVVAGILTKIDVLDFLSRER